MTGAHSRVDAAALLARVDIVQVIERYVPLRKRGPEYEACCPFHTEDTPSFKVSPTKQIYHCFGCGANGDAISFLRAHQGMSFPDAVRALGGDLPEPVEAPPAPAPAREKRRSAWQPVLPAPDDAPEPPVAHIRRGRPETVWCYRDADGRRLGYVYRFRTSTGGKEVLPLVWARNEDDGAREWHWMAFPEPRPLYGLDRLAAMPEAPVLVVEGEKCADAAFVELAKLEKPMVVVSWPGGGKAVAKADFGPLAGRKVILWPDADAKREPLTPAQRSAGANPDAQPLLPEAQQPGVKTMDQVAGVLDGLGCRLWQVAIPPPGERPDGWDVADAVDAGLIGQSLADFIRAQSVVLAPAGAGVEDAPASSLPPRGPVDPGPAGACGGFGDDSWRGLLLRKDDRLIDCRENVYLMLRHHPAWSGVIWADEFGRRIVKRKPAPWQSASGFTPGQAWDAQDDLRLGLWCAQQERMIVRAAENLSASIGWAASEQRWHPVREYLDGLRWDGTARLEHWLSDFLGLRGGQYAALSGRLFLIGMVARIYQPGCIMRHMPILEGTQYRGKSTALRILAGDDWFGDTPLDLQSKDSFQNIWGCWLYEIAELDSFSRSDVTRIKSFISSPVDRFRAPYERAPGDHARETVFGGTTNQDEYFKDQTGNTRFWPWRVDEQDSINLDGLHAARDQLFAEAVAAYRAGERWHPTGEEQRRLFEPQQAEREIQDPWESLILDWLRGVTFARVSTTQILSEALKVEPGKIDGTRQMATRIGIAMRRIGWLKRRETDGGRGYYYQRPGGWGSVGDAHGGDHAPF